MIQCYVKTKDGRELVTAYRPEEMKIPVMPFHRLQRNHKIIQYASEYICLDTETSHDRQDRGWIYQWAAKYGKTYIYGRRPSEIIDMLRILAEAYHLNYEKKIIIFVHNLSYDFQYLKHYIYQYDPTADVLAIDSHGILQVDMNGFKLICSYKLTNLSLDALSKNYSDLYVKAAGEIDYNLIRYQDSELNDTNWFYMLSDVASQYDGIKGYLRMQGYSHAYMAPITSTGFVRNSCRKNSRTDKSWRDEFRNSALDLEQYNLLRQAFMGGVTICGWRYAGETVRGDNLRHVDFTSSYPARQILDYFPVGKGSWYGEVECIEELEELCETKCCCFILTLEDVHIRPGVTAPCIPASKCIHLENGLKVNGKVVYASSLSIIVTELDWKWIKKQYNYDQIYIDHMLIFTRGQLPQWLRDTVYDYFKNKCTLKKKDPLLYTKSKNMLNGIYGMTATAIIRDKYEMNDQYILEKVKVTDKDRAADLTKYYSKYNSFMPYQAAVWTTAHARDALYTMIECIGYENFLYCDTDSAFYIETEGNKKSMEEYRQYCIQRAIDAGAYVDNNYLGEPTPEPAIRAFRGLHAKCYAMEEMTDNGEYELQVVIAGIPKESTKWIDGRPVTVTNSEELGHIDRLEDGFIFSHNGGTRCIYNERTPAIENINGHETEISSSAIIENIEKEINDTMYSRSSRGELLKIVQHY